MNMKQVFVLFISSLAISTQVANAADSSSGDKWGYSGRLAPQNWGSLEKNYVACSKGTEQSPIDIKTDTAVKGSSKVKFQSEGTSSVSVTDDAAEAYKENSNIARSDNGHTVQITFSHLTTKEALELNGVSYQIVEAHVHKKSEHTLNGKSFPLEIHTVYASKDGKLAAVGTFITEGKENPGFTALLDALPARAKQKGVVAMTAAKVEMKWLLPHPRTYYAYTGSLTTPPCGEPLQWLVMDQPIEASKDQIARMQALIPENNDRPVQPLNGREIRKLSE